ncbi:MAG: RecX family transcriptional regulator [Solirubrobacterales bacterium]|nr:RecX family transcriptional regulator [Solirubrobacterales bacterium]
MPAIEDRQQLEHALALAYRYLNRRDRTVSEVRRHLEHRGITAAALAQALETLLEQGYLDDSRYARLFTADKRELEQWGGGRIRRALLERGVERELVEGALASQQSELERALALLRRRFPSPPVDRRERERALGVLLRKGYESELALDALSAYARGV